MKSVDAWLPFREKSKNHQDEANIEFSITQDEIENYEEDAVEDIFTELSDEETQVPRVKKYKHIDEKANTSIKATRITSQQIYDEESPTTAEIESSNSIIAKKPCFIREERCEDTVFGELVTVMLKKLDTESRKRAKKEIMHILLGS